MHYISLVASFCFCQFVLASSIPHLSQSLPSLSNHVQRQDFPSARYLYDIVSLIGVLGLRTPGSPRQNILIDYVLAQLQATKDMEVNVESSSFVGWQTLNDSTLLQAGGLKLHGADGTQQNISIIGAIPWTFPTTNNAAPAELVYVPTGTNITTVNVTGKIVLRDFGPSADVPYKLLFALGLWRSNDTDALLNTSYNRPYTGSPNADLIDAGVAGAAGFISLFNVSGQQLESYFDPHEGTHYRVPGLYVGAAEAAVLKAAASKGSKATIAVHAEVSNATQRQINARLPGTTNDTIYIVCHTDGTNWVQDNGVAALLALAKYFSAQPRSSRNKTLEFVFTTGHLGYTADTTNSLAARLDKTYDTDDTVLAIALEHMGTREILPIGSDSGAPNGQALNFTGKSEMMIWCVGPSTPLRNISIASAQRHNLDRMVVAQGASLPNFNAVPVIASFGGIGTGLHQHLIPTTALISGPWSLWAPKFGASAIDFGRLRDQTIAFADVIMGVGPLSKKEIAGDYTAYRLARANGTKWALDAPPAVYAPGPRGV